MWCSDCHQDVPAVTNAVSGRLVCSRCQRPTAAKRPAHASAICDDGIALDQVGPALASQSPPNIDGGWTASRQLRELDRQLRRPILSSAAAKRTSSSALRFDPPQNIFDEGHSSRPNITADPPLPAAEKLRSNRTDGGQVLAWLVVFAGVAVSAAGVGLIYRSLAYGQPEYWNLALGLALGGQAALVLGLVMVVMYLWGNSRHAVGKLQEVQARLRHLQHTADALTAMRSGGAPAFYAELARGASPQTLLANLKGQLDQLASRLGSI